MSGPPIAIEGDEGVIPPLDKVGTDTLRSLRDRLEEEIQSRTVKETVEQALEVEGWTLESSQRVTKNLFNITITNGENTVVFENVYLGDNDPLAWAVEVLKQTEEIYGAAG